MNEAKLRREAEASRPVQVPNGMSLKLQVLFTSFFCHRYLCLIFPENFDQGY